MIERGVKTGTPKPPRKLNRHYSKFELGKIVERAETTCRMSQSDVVIFHDEREGISTRVVRDAGRMFQSKFILKTILWAKIKLIEVKHVKKKRKG